MFCDWDRVNAILTNVMSGEKLTDADNTVITAALAADPARYNQAIREAADASDDEDVQALRDAQRASTIPAPAEESASL
jgi:hypothetical protein